MKKKIRIIINKEEIEIETQTNRTLLEVLRDDLELTGTKEGCSSGECGACTVIMDGKAIPSCLVLIDDAENKEITTIEGLSKNGQRSRRGKLHPIQEAFIKFGAIQCGYCTPGVVLSTKALLDKNPNPSDEEIKKALEGNICRCTGYTKILDAVRHLRKK